MPRFRRQVNTAIGDALGRGVGTLVPLPALWHFNGAGIGFPQRSCKAEARYVAKVLPSGRARESGRDQPWCRHNAPEDQEDLHDDRRITAGIDVVQHATGGLRTLHFREQRPRIHSILEARRVALVFLSGEVEDHGSVFVAFAPRPGFRDVIVILEAEDKVMLVPR